MLRRKNWFYNKIMVQDKIPFRKWTFKNDLQL